MYFAGWNFSGFQEVSILGLILLFFVGYPLLLVLVVVRHAEEKVRKKKQQELESKPLPTTTVLSYNQIQINELTNPAKSPLSPDQLMVRGYAILSIMFIVLLFMLMSG